MYLVSLIIPDEKLLSLDGVLCFQFGGHELPLHYDLYDSAT